MKVIKKAKTNEFKNSSTCYGFEYPHQDQDMNGAIIIIKGRYPEKGFVKNLRSKELVYITKGDGILNVEGEEIRIEEGDMVIINPNEKFYWNGNIETLMILMPPFNPDEHIEVD